MSSAIPDGLLTSTGAARFELYEEPSQYLNTAGKQSGAARLCWAGRTVSDRAVLGWAVLDWAAGRIVLAAAGRIVLAARAGLY